MFLLPGDADKAYFTAKNPLTLIDDSDGKELNFSQEHVAPPSYHGECKKHSFLHSPWYEGGATCSWLKPICARNPGVISWKEQRQRCAGFLRKMSGSSEPGQWAIAEDQLDQRLRAEFQLIGRGGGLLRQLDRATAETHNAGLFIDCQADFAAP